MNSSRNQHSIASSCEVSGCGYWSAKKVTVTMHPAPADTGIRLVRTDISGSPSCDATIVNRHEASLRTNVGCGDAQFQMVEHLMAALYGLEIDNCIVEIDGEELPGLDGSCKSYVDALTHAGLVIQPVERKQLILKQVLTIREGASWITASPVPTPQSHFGYQLAYDNPGPINEQSFGFSCTPINFTREVAPARTFVTLQQAEDLHRQGVAQHVSYQELLVFGDDGPVDNELKYRNECARHKALDLVGDLSLVGVELVGKFISCRGGHRLNGKMATALHQLMVQQQKRNCEHTEQMRVA